MKKILQDRKTLYLVLIIVMISIFTLSIAYAALSTVLEISGNAQISSAEWNIYLNNPRVKNGSVSNDAPVISGTSTLSFDIFLNTPGDFYEFTVDVVNDGSIDAMIDSVVKTPELTQEQAKYIKYEVSYENGDSINTSQILNKETSTPIKVRVEYRTDIVASDLPNRATELSLKLTLVYVQSDGSGSSVPNNGENIVEVVSGDGTKVGNEVCIKEECFYVMYSDDTSITMLSKMNITLEDSPKQSSSADTTAFSNYDPFTDIYTNYSGSIAESYVNSYKKEIENLGIDVVEARLITYDELTSSDKLACVEYYSCFDKYPWVYETQYWTGTAYDSELIWYVDKYTYPDYYNYDYDGAFGIRPVIIISKNYL